MFLVQTFECLLSLHIKRKCVSAYARVCVCVWFTYVRVCGVRASVRWMCRPRMFNPAPWMTKIFTGASAIDSACVRVCRKKVWKILLKILVQLGTAPHTLVVQASKQSMDNLESIAAFIDESERQLNAILQRIKWKKEDILKVCAHFTRARTIQHHLIHQRALVYTLLLHASRNAKHTHTLPFHAHAYKHTHTLIIVCFLFFLIVLEQHRQQ